MALKAFYAYISSEPHHLPLIAAAGMLLLEPNYVTQLNLQDHAYNIASEVLKAPFIR